MTKQITIDVKTFAHLWDEVDSACMQFLSVEEGIQNGEDPDGIQPWLSDGYACADSVRRIMQRIAEKQGVSEEQLEELV